nr:zinc finger protein CONSTANS-LIKE 5-like [Ipomoea batatas]
MVPINDSNPPNFAHENFASDPWNSSASITSKLPENAPAGMKSAEFSLFDSDNFLDFEYPVSWESNSQNQYNSDRVVPIQTIKTSAPIIPQENHFEIDFTRSNLTSYNSGFTKPSLSTWEWSRTGARCRRYPTGTSAPGAWIPEAARNGTEWIERPGC